MSPRPPSTIRAGLVSAAARPLAQFREMLPKTAGPDAVEAIHDARVALRRLGAILRAFAPVLQPRTVSALKREMKWLRRELGPVRDLDVFMQEAAPALIAQFPTEAGLAAIRKAAAARRPPLAEELARAIAGRRAQRLLDMLDRVFGAEAKAFRIARAGPQRGQGAAPGGDDPYAPFARALLRRRYRKMRKGADGLAKRADEDLHRLRIRLRNFRYLCDAFGELLPKRRYAVLRKAMQALQDHLGALNDAATAPALVADLADDAARSHDPAAVARAVGIVAGWGAARRQVLKSALEEPWQRMIKRADKVIGA